MTLNSVMAVILRYFFNFGSFGAKYVNVVEVENRPILSARVMWSKEIVFNNIGL